MEQIRTGITNTFVFNNPPFDYKNTDLNSKSIIFIKKNEGIDNNIENYIPCLFIQEAEQSSKFLIFFHGNSEDIFLSELIGQYFAEILQMNVIIVEYPGYSIYNAPKNAETMCDDSLVVYSFIKNYFNLKEDDIFVLGRSIGTGPAIYLASKKKPQGLILISPFKSIKSIKGGFLGFFLLDIFKSIDIIDKVTSPILFIHGKNDHLIEYTHSKELNDKLDKLKKKSNISFLSNNSLIFNDNMTHNEMDLEKDIIDKIIEFKDKNKFLEPKKGYFNCMDKKFKQLFDIPLIVQKYLFTLNINLNKPKIIKIDSRFLLLLKDERIALVTNKNQIKIYDIEEMKNELTINPEGIGYLNFLYQLYNGILVACSDDSVIFYLLKKYNYQQVKLIEFENLIIKVEQINNNQILILTSKSLMVFNNEYQKINTIINKKYFYNMKVISPYIALQTLKTIEIFKFQNNKIEFTSEIPLENNSSISINLINIEKQFLLLLDNNILKWQNLKDNRLYIMSNIFPQNAKFIFNLYNNIIIIGNENGNIGILELNGEKILIKENKYNFIELKMNKKISSIIALKDGKLIISEAEKEKFEINAEETNKNALDNCTSSIL